MMIAIAGSKGGVGKSTSTINIAHHLNKMGIPTDIADIDQTMNLYKLSIQLGLEVNIRHVNNDTQLAEVFNKGTKYDHITLIDCAGNDSDLNRIAIANADFVFTPCSVSAFEQGGIGKFNEELIDMSNDSKKYVMAYAFIAKVHHAKRNFDDFSNAVSVLSNIKLMDDCIIPWSPKLDDAVWDTNDGAAHKGSPAERYKKLTESILKITGFKLGGK